MTWDEVCDSPYLRDLPFKIETNRYGQVVMSPVKNNHSRYQGNVARRLESLMTGGESSQDFAVETSDGIKAPDVIWMSDAFIARHQHEDTATEAPEIVVEVFSESNTRAELREKTQLFFERNAREVWLVERDGRVRFFTAPEIEAERSALCPGFPAKITPGRES